MARDKFEVGDILVCVDDSPHAEIFSSGQHVGGKLLEGGQVYEVKKLLFLGECCLVGVPNRGWKFARFRRAEPGEIRKYRKEQGYEKHFFVVGDLVVCIASDYKQHPSVGTVCVVSATKSDDERECFIDIDGGKVAGRFFAACFRKATPAEAEAYRKANEPPKAAPAAKNGVSADSIDSVEGGDVIVFVGPSNKDGRECGTLAIVQSVVFRSGDKIPELRIYVLGDGWSYDAPDGWVPVGRDYELVAQGQPIHTGDEWLVAGRRWDCIDFRTEHGFTKGTSGILRRKVKKDAVTVQIGDKPLFEAAVLDPPTFKLSFTWEGLEKKILTAHDAPEEINKAISLPNLQCLTSADGREFDIIDWNPKVQTGEIVRVEANLVPKLAHGPCSEVKLKDPGIGYRFLDKAAPFKTGDIVVCIYPTDQHVAASDQIAWTPKTYRIEQIGSVGGLRIEGVSRPEYWCPSRFRLATPAEAQAFLNAEKKKPKDPGIGYRFLDKAELIVEGDEFWSPGGKYWTASDNWYSSSNGPQTCELTYRRRNQFAAGELVQIIKPATQALRDGEPKWRECGTLAIVQSVVFRSGDKIPELRIYVLGDGWSYDAPDGWVPVGRDWLAPASSKQKAAFQAKKDKKAKIKELEDKMKAIKSELASLKGT